MNECGRLGCENVLCDRYSAEFGYICSPCYVELNKKMTSGEVSGVYEFMNSNKESTSPPKPSYNEYLDSIFPSIFW